MIYGAILAGGIGSRMKLADMPKQFMLLGDKPIIIHTTEKFIMNSRFDKIYIAVHNDWKQYCSDLLAKYKVNDKRITVVSGGKDRNDSIMQVIKDIENNPGIKDDDIIVTHDSVRPFITNRIINENIDAALQFGMCDTVVGATDTIVVSSDGGFIDEIPERSRMYQGQTPQSFNIKLLYEKYNSLSEEDKAILTDACKIFTINGDKVKLINGETFNIKITTASDYKIAQAILGGKIID